MRADAILRDVIVAATPRLLDLDGEETARPRAPGKWCARQVIGHLIDSACNNHGRFVRAQFSDDLVFPGYDQEAWVAAQGYALADWEELVGLWRSYNLHLARVIEAIPETQMVRARTRHNLHEIGWAQFPRDASVTLGDLVRDYVGHLEHHLAQVLPGYRPRAAVLAATAAGGGDGLRHAP